MGGTGFLRCDLCDRESDRLARGWRADRTLDASERLAVQVLCADCAGELVWLGRNRAPQPEPVHHHWLDEIQGVGPASAEPDSVELLAVLVVEERDLSTRRRALHTMIDRLRGELGSA